MDDFYDLLNSSDTATRLKACRQLRTVEKLTDQALFALERAEYDPDTTVARAATFTLLVQRLKKPFYLIMIVSIVLINMVICSLWLFSVGNTSRLICEREKSDARVNCLEQVYFINMIPKEEREFPDVRGAVVIVAGTDNDGLEFYNVKLTTGTQDVELKAGLSYDYPSKRKLADKINSFVDSDSVYSLTLVDHGFITIMNLFWMTGSFLVFLLLILLTNGLSRIWKWIKQMLWRREPSERPVFKNGARKA